MATGRTLPTYERVYIDGYDMSGYAVETGEWGVEFAERSMPTLTDPIVGVLLGRPMITLGPIKGVFDNTAVTGLHVQSAASQGIRRNVLCARGQMGEPAMGDDIFAAPMLQKSYKAVGSEFVGSTIELVGPDTQAAMNYNQYFGRLLHALSAETAANTANANVNNGAATAAGGWLMYHIRTTTGTGTVTISVDDSANGTSWAALSGATSGAIATPTLPVAGIVQLANTATVRQYLRWQIAFGGSATACTFALAFVRGV